MENIENTKDTVEVVAVTDVEPVKINSIRLPWNDVVRLMFQVLVLAVPNLLLVWAIQLLVLGLAGTLGASLM